MSGRVESCERRISGSREAKGTSVMGSIVEEPRREPKRRLVALSKRFMQSAGHRLPGVKLTLPRQVQDLSG